MWWTDPSGGRWIWTEECWPNRITPSRRPYRSWGPKCRPRSTATIWIWAEWTPISRSVGRTPVCHTLTARTSVAVIAAKDWSALTWSGYKSCRTGDSPGSAATPRPRSEHRTSPETSRPIVEWRPTNTRWLWFGPNGGRTGLKISKDRGKPRICWRSQEVSGGHGRPATGGGHQWSGLTSNWSLGTNAENS